MAKYEKERRICGVFANQALRKMVFELKDPDVKASWYGEEVPHFVQSVWVLEV